MLGLITMGGDHLPVQVAICVYELFPETHECLWIIKSPCLQTGDMEGTLRKGSGGTCKVLDFFVWDVFFRMFILDRLKKRVWPGRRHFAVSL